MGKELDIAIMFLGILLVGLGWLGTKTFLGNWGWGIVIMGILSVLKGIFFKSEERGEEPEDEDEIEEKESEEETQEDEDIKEDINFCDKCGAELVENAKFCDKCGEER